MHLPPKVDVIGTDISATTVKETVALLLDPPPPGLRVAVCSVHSVMTARRNPSFHNALSGADIATTDGMPLVWALRFGGIGHQERVDGYTVFRAAISAGIPRGSRHFFYGATEATLERLVSTLRVEYPTIQVAGAYAPPFRPLSDREFEEAIIGILEGSPDIVWVGIGMPKQELWMERAAPHLPGISLVGVGAVFDWVAGNVPRAPGWMQRSGLEWLYRLYREPRRLWRRYIWNNPAYLGLLAAQIVRSRVGKGHTAREPDHPRG